MRTEIGIRYDERDRADRQEREHARLGRVGDRGHDVAREDGQRLPLRQPLLHLLVGREDPPEEEPTGAEADAARRAVAGSIAAALATIVPSAPYRKYARLRSLRRRRVGRPACGPTVAELRWSCRPRSSDGDGDVAAVPVRRDRAARDRRRPRRRARASRERPAGSRRGSRSRPAGSGPPATSMIAASISAGHARRREGRWPTGRGGSASDPRPRADPARARQRDAGRASADVPRCPGGLPCPQRRPGAQEATTLPGPLSAQQALKTPAGSPRAPGQR